MRMFLDPLGHITISASDFANSDGVKLEYAYY